jgi:hypothetical protein
MRPASVMAQLPALVDEYPHVKAPSAHWWRAEYRSGRMDVPPPPSPRRAAQVRPELTIGQLTVQEQRDLNALSQRCHMMRISPQKEPLRVLPMDVDLSGVRQRLQVGVNVPNGAEHAAVVRRQRERELLGERNMDHPSCRNPRLSAQIGPRQDDPDAAAPAPLRPRERDKVVGPPKAVLLYELPGILRPRL